jgi:t-SNARE complex subunit (syntaxin)
MMNSSNNGEIDKLRVKDRTTANEKGRKEIMHELDVIMKNTTRTGQECKAYLDHIKKDNAKYNSDHKDSAKSQMRENMYQTYIRRFHQVECIVPCLSTSIIRMCCNLCLCCCHIEQVMTDYNTASYEFKKNLQERTKRQLKIVDEKLTDEEAEHLVDSGQAQEVIKQALISENLLDAVAEVEERHSV